MDIDKERAAFEVWWGKRIKPSDDSLHAQVFAEEVWRAAIASQEAAPPAAVPAKDDESGLRVVKYIEKFDAGLTTAGFTHEQRMTILGLLVDKATVERAAAPAQAVDALGIKTWRERMQSLGQSWRKSDGPQDICKDAEIADLRAALTAQPAAPVANLTCKGKGGAYAEIGVAAGAGTMRGNLVHVYRDAANGNLFYRTPMDFADRMERAPVATDGPTHDEEAAIRLRAICVRLGIGSDVPQDNTTLWCAAFAVLGQIRRALDDEQAQAVPNATRENMALVVARLEQIVATEGEFSANLVDWAKEALPCAEAVAKALNAAPLPQQVALGDSAKDADRNMIIGQAVLHHGCAWPKELSSGVMFFNGQRITKDEFDARALAAALKGGDHANA